jgi:O-antigen/teichoic acid export membrane protein
MYTIASLLTRGITLLLIPFYTVYFSPSDYGIIDIINLFTLFITAVFGLQLNQGLARYVSEPKFDEQRKIEHASTAIWFSIIMFTGISTFLLFFPNGIIRLLSADVLIETDVFIYAVIVLFLNGIFYLLGVYIRFLRLAKEFAFLTFSHALIGILFILLFVLVYDMGIKSMYVSYIIAVPPLIIIQIYVLRSKITFVIKLRALSRLLSYSAPLIPAAIAVMFMNFSDRVYIKKYLDFSELGIYAMGSKFASVVTMVVAGFGMAIMPMILEKQYDDHTKNELNRIFKLYLAIGTLGALALSLFSIEIVTITTNVRFHDASTVMPMMFYTAFMIGLAMFAPGLNIKRKTIYMAVLVCIFAGLNIILNQLLIPEHALLGAAFATLVSTVIYQLVSYKISQLYYPYPHSFALILCILLVNGIIITCLFYWNPEINLLNIGLKLLILVAYLMVLYLFKLFTFKQMISYLGRFKNKKE